jgi:tryptophanyl-tRNA synthetase
MPLPEHRVLSGVQPSGVPHIGNYLGAIQNHIKLQDEFPGECFFFIADYHALTTVRDADTLREMVRDVAVTYLALGLDPEKATLFRQSDVIEHVELTWMLSTVTGMGLLERAHSYKDKVAKGIKPSVGLFTYPVLMAADILIYQSTLVPVGKDQVQHVEMTQDMATHFNETYGEGDVLLRRPEARMSHAPYVPGLDGQKMSKSYGNTIPIWLKGKKLKKLIGQIVTDSTELGQPLPTDACNVYALLKLFRSESELEQIKGWYETGQRDGQPFGYGHAKALLVESLEGEFAAGHQKRDHLLANPKEVDDVLGRGAARARVIARETVSRCKRACGLT